MNEKDLNKIQFFQLLHLKAITPRKDSSKILENRIFISSSKYNNLLEKNNKIITGYENFCITKGITKLFPSKDFDFIGQHVVCQKCCQKFASRKSYKAHVGTEICVRSYNGPNLIYLKYKNRNCRQVRKKEKKSQTDLHNHDIKKNLLNPEMLNTLQTRNNCYSDVVHERNKNKEKQVNSSNKSDEPYVKKPRGRPKKILKIVVERKKQRGRPRKLNRNDSLNQDNISLDNNLENYKIALEEPRTVNECSTEDAYNNNINKIEKIQIISSKFKTLINKCQKLINSDWEVDNNTNGFPNSTGRNQTQCNNGDKKCDNSVKDKEFIINIESIENDLINLLSKQFFKNEYKEKLEFMLSQLREKQNEYNQKKLIKTDMNNESTTDKGKENIQSTKKKTEDENDVNKNKIDNDKNEKCVEVWLNDERGTISPAMSMISNDNREELSSNDNYKDNLEVLTEDMTPNCTNSVNNHAYNSLNYIFNPPLECKVCGKPFESIAEWKMHLSEHLSMVNGKFLCTTCGLKFNMYKNFIKHMNIHGKIEQNTKNNKPLKKYFRNLKCRKCNKQYNYLRSYFSHIKTHI